jgi:PPOX class probable F420-dependent enzyme
MAKMTDHERDAFLAQVRVAVLAIERFEKGPLCAPVWYRYRDGSFEIAMANASAKAKLLRRYGRASLCVQDEDHPYRYVTVEGEVDVVAVSASVRDAFLRDVASRYLGDKRGQQYADDFPGHEEAIVTLRPRQWQTEVLGG